MVSSFPSFLPNINCSLFPAHIFAATVKSNCMCPTDAGLIDCRFQYPCLAFMMFIPSSLIGILIPRLIWKTIPLSQDVTALKTLNKVSHVHVYQKSLLIGQALKHICWLDFFHFVLWEYYVLLAERENPLSLNIY